MSEIVNLNRARKGRAKASAKSQAVENRARFGRTKAEKTVEAAEKLRTEKHTDGHKRS